jgi:hypothetical protein
LKKKKKKKKNMSAYFWFDIAKKKDIPPIECGFYTVYKVLFFKHPSASSVIKKRSK